ncbi:hypothetical protein LTS17_009509 [Exophiala oligosperma]
MAADLTDRATSLDKPEVDHHQDDSDGLQQLEEAAAQSGPYKDTMFIGTIVAAGFGMIGGTGSYGLPASVLTQINNDIGPDSSYFWIGVVNTLTLAAGFTLVGRLTDTFGRRWFVVGGNILALIGTIVASRAMTVKTLIGANVLSGLGAVVQTSVPFTVGELVPMKQRYVMVSLMYVFAIPTAAFGPMISWAFVLHTSAGWRWCYYFMTITNAVSALGWFLFYHPPTFHMKQTKSRIEVVKSMDVVGIVLFTGGLVVFLMGLSWGGSAYPWDSAHVIATMVVGGCSLVALVLWECFANLSQPLIPMHLFRNIGWVVNVLTMCMAASCYYGFSIIFPQMVFMLYTSDAEYGSRLACAAPASFLLGTILAGMSGYIGRQKYQVVIASVIAAPLLGGIACVTVDNKATVLGLIITGSVAIGYVEGVSVTSTGISIKNQEEIGAAVGVASTCRAAWATVATTIYLSVLQNKLKDAIKTKVVPTLVKAGLPLSSVPAFLAAFSTGSFAQIPGATPDIIATGVSSYREALVYAFRMVFYTALALLLTNCILALFFPNLDHKMKLGVAARLHRPGKRNNLDSSQRAPTNGVAVEKGSQPAEE